MRDGRVVNLERPLRADARLGGHFVQGHVDGVGRVRALRPRAISTGWTVEFPAELAPLLIPKGSIAVDGISLTVARSRGPTSTCRSSRSRGRTPRSRTSGWRSRQPRGDMLGKYVVRVLETQAARV